MNVIDAAYSTVHDYPGGSESLGPRIGMSAAMLRNKVNPNNATHHLTLAEADKLIGLSEDHRILHALAATHGYTLQRADAPDAGNVVSALLAAAAAKGNLSTLLAAVLADGVVTSNEAKGVAGAGALLQAAVAEIVAQAYRAAQQSRGAQA